MTEDTMWRPANNGSGARMWFVMRRTNPPTYHRSVDGRIIRYGSHESARAKADMLNEQVTKEDTDS